MIGLRIAPTERDVVFARGSLRLYRYRPRVAEPLPVPVILVPSIINRSYIFDLAEGQSLAAHLLDRGLDVHILDWGTPAAADAHLDLAGYVRLLGEATAAVRRLRGAASVHLFGYCLGGTMSVVAALRRNAGVLTLVLLATPVDLAEPGPLGVLVDPRLLDAEILARAFPVVPGAALWAAFQALDPVGILRKWRGFWDRVRDRPFRERFLAQETWVADPVPVTGRALADIVHLYRENALVRGTLAIEGAAVRLSDGRTPILNLVAEGDTIVPPACSIALERFWGGPVETRTFPGGHIGVTVGSRAPAQMWAAASGWLAARQSRCPLPPGEGGGARPRAAG